MKKFVVAILAVAVVWIGAFVAIAQTTHEETGKRWNKEGKHRFGKKHRKVGMMFRRLDLTEDQKAQVKAMREASQPTIQPLMEAMKQNRQKFMEARKAGADEATLAAIRAEIAPIREQIKAHREASMNQMMSILTEEQKAKLAAMKEKRQERMKERRGKRSGFKSESGGEL